MISLNCLPENGGQSLGPLSCVREHHHHFQQWFFLDVNSRVPTINTIKPPQQF